MKVNEVIRNNIMLKSNQLIRYYDLGFILNNLENLIRLPVQYKDSKTSHWQYMNNKQIALETHEKSDHTLEQLLSELELRETTFEYLRTIKPDFCTDISKRLSEEEYQEYLVLLRECTRNLSSIINSFKDNKDYKDNYRLLLSSKKDIVSTLVDKDVNSRLAYIQDTFVLEELDSLEGLDIDPTIQKNISILRNQLLERIAKYKEFEKLYSCQNKIRLTSKGNHGER